jgi:hypothetical protein
MRRTTITGAVLGATLLFAPRAHAGDTATAEALFQSGLEKLKAGQYAEACTAFQGSEDADASPGTEINLGTCNEKQGKLASAWGWYNTAAGSADRRGQADRAKKARDEADRLKPLLHYLVINVKTPAEEMKVTRDNVVVPQAALGTSVPIDPGEHAIRVTAKGKKAWNGSVKTEASPGTTPFDVPPLVDEPVAPAAGGGAPGGDYRPPSGGDPGQKQRTIGYLVGGGGVLLGIVAGGIVIFNFAVTVNRREDQKNNAVDKGCDLNKDENDAFNASKPGCGGSDGIVHSYNSYNDSAHANQTAAIIVGAVGAAAIIGGVVLILTAPSGEKSGERKLPRILPVASPNGAGVVGTF